ncbi:regulatory-associated protein of mTOR [Pelomyxa schiedti]|nr:regulatory-associated protein of mTOR [Pelomyxa schiedti]
MRALAAPSSSSSSSSSLRQQHCNYFTEERHTSGLMTSPSFTLGVEEFPKWNSLKDKSRTVYGILSLCLNIGVDPPDVIKPHPCATLECWIDPAKSKSSKCLDQIMAALKTQYESWAKIPYQLCPDPITETIRQQCTAHRRNSREERVLFHYNGHGVPQPTNNGEVWVFNKDFSQYIPLSVSSLMSWVGTPSLYVFDCNAAGLVLQWFLNFAEQHRAENPSESADFLILAACGAKQLLPMSPNYPADLFTSCLTSPLRMALHWFCKRNAKRSKVNEDQVDSLPGTHQNKRSPFGELNWIFTTITDTIAWNVLPTELFQKLYRQDLLVSSLFRNFLLAERIMRSLNCTPITHPKLPPTFQHRLWDSWDMVVESVLAQLPQLIKDPAAWESCYQNSSFFSEQLTAFELAIEFGFRTKIVIDPSIPPPPIAPPEQLPIVLQVLLNPTHRARALSLLSRFLDLGSFAVSQALSVGIFPYVLRLLQTSVSPDLRDILVFIWAKILAFDPSCQADLLKDSGHKFFLGVLGNPSVPSLQRVMSAFILSVIVDSSPNGQLACLQGNILPLLMSLISDPDPLLRRWAALCLGKLWHGCEEAKSLALAKFSASERLAAMTSDHVPEVRAAAVFALGNFFGTTVLASESRSNSELSIALAIGSVVTDGSPLVRREAVVSLSRYIAECTHQFLAVASEELSESQNISNKRKPDGTSTPSEKRVPQGSPLSCIWKFITDLEVDPSIAVASQANLIVDRIKQYIDNTEKSKRSLSSFPRHQQPPVAASPVDKRNLSMKTPSADMDLSSQIRVQSPFYKWCCNYFAKPLLHLNEKDTTSVEARMTEKRKVHNAGIVREASELWNSVGVEKDKKKLQSELAILNQITVPAVSLLFHPFLDIIIVADEQSQISTFDITSQAQSDSELMLMGFRGGNSVTGSAPSNTAGRPRSCFANMNPIGSRITTMSLVNEQDDDMLIVGSEDGVVRVWKNYREEKPVVVSAWRALPKFSQTQSVGLLFDWLDQGLLLAAGVSAVARVWDITKELPVLEIPTESKHAVTAVSCDKNGGKTYAIGCGDGIVRIFTLMEHKSWIANVGLPCSTQIYTASGITETVKPEIKIWDLSNTSRPCRSIPQPDLTTFAYHPRAPLFASGSSDMVKVFNSRGDEINQIRYHVGFLGQRISQITCLAFHPYKVWLAGGFADRLVSVWHAQ